MSLNPYASGEAALPTTEAEPRAPKVAVASAVFASIGLLGMASLVAIMFFSIARDVQETDSFFEMLAVILAASVISAMLGFPLGIAGLFMRKHPRTVALVSTFLNGAMLACTGAMYLLYLVDSSKKT